MHKCVSFVGIFPSWHYIITTHVVNESETSLTSTAPNFIVVLISTDFIQFPGQILHLAVEQQVRRTDYLLFINL